MSPPALSVAILPFAGPSGDPANEQFADAFTQDLTMALGRDLRVALVMFGAGAERGPALAELEKVDFVVETAIANLKNS